mmetsp:Transcript_38541/g.46590  ORF Transcript_38541/g.46590 Transcript_38541/m.46590 type:complete len:329 (+) Transcript_38541:440-1426(+)|eukprot:CAMPEP_0197848078 /NCGR_PEP_ID=MMETSP1438-20131217/7912_1 /TAXON_ID=1461541 /ORGANISM="Pterosperma sp., Strain CCMP1384" /LENGTH=328 /DNA_ID=CAMNT_0043460207 /DNA_START=426 /DNA_END=1412 /DNA_ORIENTATION=+
METRVPLDASNSVNAEEVENPLKADIEEAQNDIEEKEQYKPTDSTGECTDAEGTKEAEGQVSNDASDFVLSTQEYPQLCSSTEKLEEPQELQPNNIASDSPVDILSGLVPNRFDLAKQLNDASIRHRGSDPLATPSISDNSVRNPSERRSSEPISIQPRRTRSYRAVVKEDPVPAPYHKVDSCGSMASSWSSDSFCESFDFQPVAKAPVVELYYAIRFANKLETATNADKRRTLSELSLSSVEDDRVKFYRRDVGFYDAEPDYQVLSARERGRISTSDGDSSDGEDFGFRLMQTGSQEDVTTPVATAIPKYKQYDNRITDAGEPAAVC